LCSGELAPEAAVRRLGADDPDAVEKAGKETP